MSVLLMYGGKSCEHDISVITGKQAAANIKKDFHEVFVSKEGKWLLADEMKNISDFSNAKKISRLPQVVLVAGEKKLFKLKGKKLLPFCEVDAALLCFHGENGEDGCVQGLLEMCEIPYTSCGVTSSALCMDKISAKAMLKGFDFPVVEGISLEKSFFEQNFRQCESEIRQKLGYPVIVKPSKLGSSIGISVCEDENSFADAMKLALGFDDRVLVEKALTNFCDINVSVLKKDGEIFVSQAEKPASLKNFLTFDEKYLEGGKGMSGLKREFPFENEKTEAIKDIAKKVYSSLNCFGVVRIDFLIDFDSGKIFVNEINTIPGSLSFYLWKDVFGFGRLIDVLLDEAKKRTAEKQKLLRRFESSVLNGASGGKIKGRKF